MGDSNMTKTPVVLPRGDVHFDTYEMEGLVSTPQGRTAPTKPPAKNGSKRIKWLIGTLSLIAIGVIIHSDDTWSFTNNGNVVAEPKGHGSDIGQTDGDMEYTDTDEGLDMVDPDDDDDGEDNDGGKPDDENVGDNEVTDDESEGDDKDTDKDDKSGDGEVGDNTQTGDDGDDGKDGANDTNIDGGEETKSDDDLDGDVEFDDDFEAVILTDEEEEARKETLIEKWGKWHFWDGAEEMRPKEDYLAKYPNRDCTFDAFPMSSWQVDAVYVNHMIDSAEELVDRAKEAIYTEYGFGPREEITDEQLVTRMSMFRAEFLDLEADDVTESTNMDRGGWTTKKSFRGVARRLLHAMMTNDDFTIVLAGDSSAAGLGNHFLQSYMMQFHNIMEPIMERLGVKLVTKNLANAAVGTLPTGLGSGSIYGEKVDMIIWDSEISDGYDNEAAADLFFRQALLAGDRPPALVGPPSLFNVLKNLHNNVDGEFLIFNLLRKNSDNPMH